MKPFKLQSILDHRTTVKNIAQQELYQTIDEEIKLEETLLSAKKTIETLCAELECHQKEGITSHELSLFEKHCEHKEYIIQQLEKALIDTREKIAEQRRVLIEANRDKKLIEKLKEKQTKQYKHILRKKEDSETDEISVQIHGR